MPKDARVLFEIVRAPVRPVAAALATPLWAANPAAHDWSALGEAIGALATTQPNAARNLLAMVMPRPDTRLGATALLFLSALKGGDIQTWIGAEAAHAIERARGDLLPRITEEFRQAARNADEPLVGDWRFVPVPFWDGAELRPIRLFTRPYRGKNENDKPGKRIGTRFIVDLDLTRLGRLQLDGLVREGNKRFDLIVRSVELFPEFMRDDIRRLFAESCELVGMKGGASFQAAAAFVEIEATPVAGPGILA